MPFITANDFNATFAAGFNAAATSLSLTAGQGSRLPVVAAPDVLPCLLIDGTNFEYVDIIAHTAGSDTITVTRAVDAYQSGTPTALIFTSAAKIVAVQTKRMTEGALPVFLADNADPVAKPGGLQIYSKLVGGRHFLKWIGPFGVDYRVQEALYDNNVVLWTPGGAAAFAFIGDAPTVTGTISTVTPAAGSFGAEINARNIATAATATTSVGILGSTAQYARIVAAGHGGFHLFIRFIIGTVGLNTSYRCFLGLSSIAALPTTVEPSAQAASQVGIGCDAADTTLFFMYKDGSTAQKVAIAGSTKVAGRTYDVDIYCPAGDGVNAGGLFYRVVDVNAGTTLQENIVTGLTTNAPLANTFMRPVAYVGTLTAVAQNLKLAKFWATSDY